MDILEPGQIIVIFTMLVKILDLNQIIDELRGLIQNIPQLMIKWIHFIIGLH